MAEAIWGFVIACLLLALVFLVLREVVLWYWKVNKIVETQEAILAELRRLTGNKVEPLRIPALHTEHTG